MSNLIEHAKEHQQKKSQLKEKFAIVTIHDVCPTFSSKYLN